MKKEIYFIELTKSKGINSEEVDNIDSLVKWIEFIVVLILNL